MSRSVMATPQRVTAAEPAGVESGGRSRRARNEPGQLDGSHDHGERVVACGGRGELDVSASLCGVVSEDGDIVLYTEEDGVVVLWGTEVSRTDEPELAELAYLEVRELGDASDLVAVRYGSSCFRTRFVPVCSWATLTHRCRAT